MVPRIMVLLLQAPDYLLHLLLTLNRIGLGDEPAAVVLEQAVGAAGYARICVLDQHLGKYPLLFQI